MSGFGGMMSIVLDTNLEGVNTFLSNLKIFTLAESLGGVESLIEHPAIMTHASIDKKFEIAWVFQIVSYVCLLVSKMLKTL